MMLSITGEIAYYCIAFHICFVVFFLCSLHGNALYLLSEKFDLNVNKLLCDFIYFILFIYWGCVFKAWENI